jgi:replicative DNA helicase
VEQLKINKKLLSREKNEAVKKAANTFADHKLWLDGKTFLLYDLPAIYLERKIAEKNIKVLIIDYLRKLRSYALFPKLNRRIFCNAVRISAIFRYFTEMYSQSSTIKFTKNTDTEETGRISVPPPFDRMDTSSVTTS